MFGSHHGNHIHYTIQKRHYCQTQVPRCLVRFGTGSSHWMFAPPCPSSSHQNIQRTNLSHLQFLCQLAITDTTPMRQFKDHPKNNIFICKKFYRSRSFSVFVFVLIVSIYLSPYSYCLTTQIITHYKSISACPDIAH